MNRELLLEHITDHFPHSARILLGSLDFPSAQQLIDTLPDAPRDIASGVVVTLATSRHETCCVGYISIFGGIGHPGLSAQRLVINNELLQWTRKYMIWRVENSNIERKLVMSFEGNIPASSFFLSCLGSIAMILLGTISDMSRLARPDVWKDIVALPKGLETYFSCSGVLRLKGIVLDQQGG